MLDYLAQRFIREEPARNEATVDEDAAEGYEGPHVRSGRIVPEVVEPTLVRQLGQVIDGCTLDDYGKTLGKTECAAGAVDSDHTHGIIGHGLDIAPSQIVDPVSNSDTIGDITSCQLPVAHTVIERVLIDDKPAVRWRMRSEGLDHHLEGIGHPRKGRMQTDLGVGIQLERRMEIAGSFAGQAFKQARRLQLAHLAIAELSRPADTFDECRPRAVAGPAGIPPSGKHVCGIVEQAFPGPAAERRRYPQVLGQGRQLRGLSAIPERVARKQAVAIDSAQFHGDPVGTDVTLFEDISPNLPFPAQVERDRVVSVVRTFGTGRGVN